MKKIIGILLLLVSMTAYAFEVEKDVNPNKEYYDVINGVPMVCIDGACYSVTTVPSAAEMVTNESNSKLINEFSSHDLGVEISKDEAARVLDVYYKAVSFDYSSVKIKNLNVSGLAYWYWCDNPLFGLCTSNSKHLFMGNNVVFQINAKNRSGGFTGYQDTLLLIRRGSEQHETVSMAQLTATTSAKTVFGVTFVDLNPKLLDYFHNKDLKGVVIFTVAPKSVAETAGIKVEDIIFQFDGKPTLTITDLQKAVAETALGKKVVVKAIRKNQEVVFDAQF